MYILRVYRKFKEPTKEEKDVFVESNAYFLVDSKILFLL